MQEGRSHVDTFKASAAFCHIQFRNTPPRATELQSQVGSGEECGTESALQTKGFNACCIQRTRRPSAGAVVTAHWEGQRGAPAVSSLHLM